MITLYQHTEYGDSSISFTSDDECLANNSFNDSASSIKIEPLTADLRALCKESLRLTKAFGQKTNVDWFVEQVEDKKVKQYIIKHGISEYYELETLSVVPAKDATGILEYNYTHDYPIVGLNFYQVIIQYEDGTENYQMLDDIEINGKPETLFIAPNPAQDFLKVDVSKFENQSIDYFVRAIDGTHHIEGTLPADHGDTIEIDLRNIQNGLYLIYMNPERHRAMSAKFVIAKDY